MNTETSTLSGPDLTLGIPLSTLPEGAMLQGHAGGEAVLLVRRAGRLFAVGAFCTHYGAPLVGGLVVEETIRCPWHHACFDLRTGGVLRAPARQVVLADGSRCAYDALLLATGASPVHLDIPGSSLPHVHYLRTAADSRNLVAATVGAKRAVIIGASFIGLEVAASLRARGIEVHVVGKDTVLMEADVEVDGDLQERNCTIIFRRRGKKVAVALIHRDLEGLHAELEFERSADRHGDRPGPGAPALLSAGG